MSMRTALLGKRKLQTSIVVAVALCAAACGESGGSQGSATGSGASLGSDKATGSTFTVGWVNSDTGPYSLPEITAAADAAVAHVNANGGINGHVLALDKCSTDGTPTASTACANKMVTAKVPVVLEGIDVGIDAADPIYNKAGIPVFGTGGTPGIQSDPANTFMAPPPLSSQAAVGQMFGPIGAKKAVQVALNLGPIIQQSFGVEKSGAKSVGVDLSLSLVDPANPDVTSAVTAAQATNADAIALSFSENDCTNAIRTIKSSGFSGKIVAGPCQAFIKELGKQAEGVFTYQFLFPANAQAAAEALDPRLKDEFEAYRASMQSVAPKYQDVGMATTGFSTVMTFVNIARTIDGDPTTAALVKSFSEFTGHDVLGGEVNCKEKLTPGASCGRQLLLLKVNADGTQSLVNNKPFFIKP